MQKWYAMECAKMISWKFSHWIRGASNLVLYWSSSHLLAITERQSLQPNYIQLTHQWSQFDAHDADQFLRGLKVKVWMIPTGVLWATWEEWASHSNSKHIIIKILLRITFSWQMILRASHSNIPWRPLCYGEVPFIASTIVFKFLLLDNKKKVKWKCVTITMITNNFVLLQVEQRKKATVRDHQKAIINKEKEGRTAYWSHEVRIMISFFGARFVVVAEFLGKFLKDRLKMLLQQTRAFYVSRNKSFHSSMLPKGFLVDRASSRLSVDFDLLKLSSL